MAKKKVTEENTMVNECNTCDDQSQCPETAASAPTPEAAKEAKERQVMNVNYRFVKKPGEGDKKLPLQANQILDILAGTGQESEDGPFSIMARKDLLDRMKDVVVTRQPIERILGYYQPILTKAGYISVEK